MEPLTLFFITILGIAGYADYKGDIDITAAASKAGTAITSVVEVSENKETGLTDITVAGKTVSLDVEPLDYNKLNK